MKSNRPTIIILAYSISSWEEYEQKFFNIYSQWLIKEIFCSECKSRSNAKKHSSYLRSFKNNDKLIQIIIYRLKCLNCGRTHAIIPFFLVPYKRYSAEEIDSAISQKAAGVPDEYNNSTSASMDSIRIWWRWVRANSGEWLTNLRRLALDITGKILNCKDNFWTEILRLLQILNPAITRVLPSVIFSHSFHLLSG